MYVYINMCMYMYTCEYTLVYHEYLCVCIVLRACTFTSICICVRL